MGTVHLEAKSAVVSGFKSPLRVLVRAFRMSRDQWKSKYMVLKAEIKRFKNQAADARRSREKWQSKARDLAATTQRLQAELGEVQARLEATEKSRM